MRATSAPLASSRTSSSSFKAAITRGRDVAHHDTARRIGRRATLCATAAAASGASTRVFSFCEDDRCLLRCDPQPKPTTTTHPPPPPFNTHTDGTSTSTSTSASASAADQDAWDLLRAFTAAEARGGAAAAQAFLGSADARARLRGALLAAYASPRPSAGWLPPAQVSTTTPAGPGDADGATTTATTTAVAAPTTAATTASSPVLLGVVAGDARTAVRALRDWCGALSLDFALPECRVPGASALADVRGGVYVKYSSAGPACHLSSYQGRDRGVLVQLGTDQFGHFPMGLFDEGKEAPPPPGV